MMVVYEEFSTNRHGLHTFLATQACGAGAWPFVPVHSSSSTFPFARPTANMPKCEGEVPVSFPFPFTAGRGSGGKAIAVIAVGV